MHPVLPSVFALIALAAATATPLQAQTAAPWVTPGTVTAATRQQVGEYVTQVYRDRRGTLWLGTLSEGLCRHDASGFRCLGPADGYRAGALRAVLETPDGALWLGGQSGLSRFDGEAFVHFTTRDGLPSDQVWSLLRDRKGQLWIGTNNGVAQFDGARFVPFELPLADAPDAQPRFSTRLAFDLLEDRHGNIWFGTDGVGAVKYDGEHFTRFTREQGLGSNDISSIVEDSHGDLWFTSRTKGGITRFDGQQFTRYTVRDGLPVDEARAGVLDRQGGLWFGTGGGGAVRFDGQRFTVFRDDSGLTRNHVQHIFQDVDGTMWFGFSGGLFRLSPDRGSGQASPLINVLRSGPW